MSKAPGTEPLPFDPEWVFENRHQPRPIPIAFHRGVLEPGTFMPVEEADTVLVCGFLGCDLRPFNPLLPCSSD